MKLERIQTTQRLPINVEEAWDFFTSPANLSFITPPWLDYRLQGSPPEYLHPGVIYSARIRPFPGVSVQWITEITHIRPPSFFITEQRIGPFKLWHHEHLLREHEDGVEIEDVVLYGLHLGPIGSLFHDLVVRKKLHDIFTYRARALEHRFGSVHQSRRPQRSRTPSLQHTQPQSRPKPNRQKSPLDQPQPRPAPSSSQKQPPTPDSTITLEDIFGGTPDD